MVCMKLKKLAVVGAFAALAVALAATASSLVYVCRKVRAFEAEHGGDVFANMSKEELDKKVKEEIAAIAKKAAVTNVVQAKGDGGKVAAPSKPKVVAPPPPPPPSVNFAAPGRYLPPGGAHAIGIESINVTNFNVEVRRVEPRNVVQLLAREEGVYNRYSWGGGADDKETEELSGEFEKTVVACENRPNQKETHSVPVVMKDGGPTNGIYLVSVLNADIPRKDYRWGMGEWNPARYRLVCLSDLGLSVRQNGTDSPGVWVTSLTTGRPVDGAVVEVYSKSNTKILEGATDENGWCRPVRVAKGEPFAVIVSSASGDDSTFLAMRSSMGVDETYSDGCRPEYLADSGVEAFLWTERGIYRHDEKILLHALVRDGKRRAPKPIPVELRLVNPKGDVAFYKTLTTDATGSIAYEGFVVPAEQPSGEWKLLAKLPGKNGRILGSRAIKIEEFAPPQIRVKVAAEATAHPSNFAFAVSAEHLFGGPAHALACEGAVVFEDACFAPANWKGWRFGNDDRQLKPSFRRVGKTTLDKDGACRFNAPLWAESGLPAAAVRATAQGTVFEDGGRPATARDSHVLHYYPYYIGSTLSGYVRLDPGGRTKVRLVCVKPDGSRLGEARRLSAKLERIDSVYSFRERDDGWESWDCERVRSVVADNLAVEAPADEDAILELPISRCGDYALAVTDPETLASFGTTFYVGSDDDEAVRAPLSNPTEVTLAPDKPFYRVGETPRLRVRSPFAGATLVSVLRDKDAYVDILTLTNATSEIVLRPVTAADAPNLDVYVSVVQSVAENARHMASRAHGQATISVRPEEDEIPVAVTESKVEFGMASGADVRVAFAAPGAAAAIVTIVDEGINLLTDEQLPDPLGHFARARSAEHPLYDLYHRILPVLGEDLLRASGIKTGGGAGAEMLGRVSPVATRRFKPLAMWSGPIAIGADGKGEWKVRLPEFVGEVRATVVAWSASATGSACTKAKVSPNIVTMPDAPRFVAPGDVFELSLPIYNKSGETAKMGYEISVGGKNISSVSVFSLEKDGHTNIIVRTTAPEAPGELDIVYHVRGMGEVHDQTIHLPVRPAVAWVETAGVERGQGPGVRERPFERYSEKVYDSPVGQYEAALRWLADYPHGCLEQTSSRIFPLIGAGGILATVSPMGDDIVRAGVKRVESMVRSTDFVMWPDCNYAPWDPEVSLYAAHFLVEAGKAGYPQNKLAKDRVASFLHRWAMSTNTAVSAYACHTLALAGQPEKDRMLMLYDASTNLTLISRARLARAFAVIHDRRRAEALLSSAVAPSSVKEAAFCVLALLEIDPADQRLLPLVAYLDGQRDRERFSWGTTGDNAHALLAIGAYYRHHPAKPGEKFIVWHKLSLPKPKDVKDESRGISIVRHYLMPEGGEADLSKLSLGEMLIAELAIKVDDTRELSDLVIEDLFPACFEPVHGGLAPSFAPRGPDGSALARSESSLNLDQGRWVMRSDARDDRMLVFSKKFTLAKGAKATFRYPVRVVSAGDYILPGPSVEAMYHPDLHARRAPDRIFVKR